MILVYLNEKICAVREVVDNQFLRHSERSRMNHLFVGAKVTYLRIDVEACSVGMIDNGHLRRLQIHRDELIKVEAEEKEMIMVAEEAERTLKVTPYSRILSTNTSLFITNKTEQNQQNIANIQEEKEMIMIAEEAERTLKVTPYSRILSTNSSLFITNKTEQNQQEIANIQAVDKLHVGETIWHRVLKCKTTKEALDLVRKESPADYINKKSKIIAAMKDINVKKVQCKFEKNSFCKGPYDLSKCIVMVGPTNIGKTQLALSHFNNPLYVTTKQQLIQLNSCSDYDGIVFDDINFSAWKWDDVLHLCDLDNPMGIDVKYSHAVIPEGMKRIICCNTLTTFYPKNIQLASKAALQRRIKIIKFNNEKLYN